MNRIERMSVFCKTLNPILISLVLLFLIMNLMDGWMGVQVHGWLDVYEK